MKWYESNQLGSESNTMTPKLPITPITPPHSRILELIVWEWYSFVTEAILVKLCRNLGDHRAHRNTPANLKGMQLGISF